MHNLRCLNNIICRSLRIAGRSDKRSDKKEQSENTTSSTPTSITERGASITHIEPLTLAQAAAKLSTDSTKSSTHTASSRTRARYLLELDHRVSDDVLQNMLRALQEQGLLCDVIGGSDDERYIVVTANFEVLAAQVLNIHSGVFP